MAYDFPAAPTNGQQFTPSGGPTYVWDSTAGAWTGPTTSVVPYSGDVGRNLLHNPLFNVAQRGAGPVTAFAAYTLDRWLTSGALDAMSVTQVALADAARTAIGDEQAAFALQNVFTGNAGAGALSYMQQRVENLRRLAGKTVTVSFWAAATVGTPKLGVNLVQYFGTGGSPSAALWALATGASVQLSATWTRYSVTIPVPSIVTKTLGTNGDDWSGVSLFYSSGATANGTAGNIGVQSGTVQLWGVQAEIGSVATALEKPDPQQDLAKCQRFYQTGTWVLYGYNVLGQGIAYVLGLPVTMRGPATPTVALVTTSSTNLSGIAITAVSGAGLQVYAGATATGAGNGYGTFTASADL